MKAKASEPRGVPFFESSDKSLPLDQVKTDSKKQQNPRNGWSGGIRTHDPFTPSEGEMENGT